MPGIVCDICGQNEMEPVDGEPNMYRCAYCGTKYSKEQLQERLVKIEGPIKVEGVQDFDKLLENGNTFLKLGELGKAYDVFNRLTNEYPSRYESWYGYVKTCIERGETTDGKIKQAKKVANDLEKMQILQDLKSIANKLETDGNFQKAIRVHEVITEGFPEIYLSWYDYVRCNIQMDHISTDEFCKAVELAGDQEKNLMISQLMSIAKDLEKAGEYYKSANIFELLIQGFPEKAVGYYGFVRGLSKKFREYSANQKFDERLEKAVELSKQEENQTYINDLETYSQIKKNIFEIRKAQADIERFVSEKNGKLSKTRENYLKEENSRRAETDAIRNKSNAEISELKMATEHNKAEVNSIQNAKKKGFKNVVWKGPLGWILSLALELALIVGYWRLTFASGSVGLGFLGLFLIEIPIAIHFWIWDFTSTCWNNMTSRSNAKKRVKKLEKMSLKNQKKIDKLTQSTNNKVNSKNEAYSAELKTFADKRDQEEADINQEAEKKVTEKENFIGEMNSKNEELFTKISA